jgi:transposase
VQQERQVKLTLLTSIPGIGLKTALFMIVITDGFDKFQNAKQLCSYVGITPTRRESGSSVSGRSRISKVLQLLNLETLMMKSTFLFYLNK